MNVKKRALHLAVTAGLVGSLVAVAAPSAHAAAPPLPDTCAVFIQGPIDPLGGVLPNAIPLSTPSPQIFYAVGHDIKGQNKTVVNVNDTTLGATRFSYGVSMTSLVDGQPYSIKYAWKNDKTTTANHTLPTVSVKGAVQKVKGVITGVGGSDTYGAVIGNITQGDPLHVPPTVPVYQVLVPAAATSGTYTIAFSIGANSFGPGVPPANVNVALPFAYNASTAVIQGTLNAALAGLSASAVVAGTSSNYTITFGGSFTAAAPIITIGGKTSATPQTGTLATTQVDDGSLWNGSRFGGTNPGISPVSILPQGIVTVNGMYSNGPVSLPKGKTSFAPDTQATALGFPAGIVSAVAPRLGTTETGIVATTGALAGLVGAPAAAVNDVCGLGGLLALFCTAEAALIPPLFASICPGILG